MVMPYMEQFLTIKSVKWRNASR